MSGHGPDRRHDDGCLLHRPTHFVMVACPTSMGLSEDVRRRGPSSGLCWKTSPDGHTTPRSRLRIRLRESHSSWWIVDSSNQMWLGMSETLALCCPGHARLLGGRGRSVVVAVRWRGDLGGGRWAGGAGGLGCGEDEVIEVSAHAVAGA